MKRLIVILLALLLTPNLLADGNHLRKPYVEHCDVLVKNTYLFDTGNGGHSFNKQLLFCYYRHVQIRNKTTRFVKGETRLVIGGFIELADGSRNFANSKKAHVILLKNKTAFVTNNNQNFGAKGLYSFKVKYGRYREVRTIYDPWTPDVGSVDNKRRRKNFIEEIGYNEELVQPYAKRKAFFGNYWRGKYVERKASKKDFENQIQESPVCVILNKFTVERMFGLQRTVER